MEKKVESHMEHDMETEIISVVNVDKQSCITLRTLYIENHGNAICQGHVGLLISCVVWELNLLFLIYRVEGFGFYGVVTAWGARWCGTRQGRSHRCVAVHPPHDHPEFKQFRV